MKQRNYGIDLLRILAMFFVVILHILGEGGILEAVEENEVKFALSWFLEIAAYCAVDCYALVTGFVYFSKEDKPCKFSKFIALWLQVEFYSVLITVLFKIIRPDLVNIKQILKSVFPVMGDQYWYFTAYTGVFFGIPYLNKMVRGLKEEYLPIFKIGLIGFTLWLIGTRILGTDPFALKGGYTFLWLAILYIIGATIKKYELDKKFQIKNCLLIIGFFIFLTWGWKIGIGKITSCLFGKKILDNLLISYTSPTILGIAIAMLMIFVNLRVEEKFCKIIKFFSVSAFAVYLIHGQPLVYQHILSKKFVWVEALPTYWLPIIVVGSAILIFIICVFIDKIRMGIFKELKINKVCEKLENGFYEKITNH